MTTLPRALILKEARALAPVWLGAALTTVAGTQAGMEAGALLAFILGAVALGVFSIGHEYANRTLTSLLAQPLDRSRLLLSKVVVLAPLLVLLSLVAAFVLFRAEGVERLLGGTPRVRQWGALAPVPVDTALVSRWQLTIIVLTPLLGLCVAPWLTMVFRNVTAGLVFTLAIPAALWIAGQIGRAASVDFDFVELEIGSSFGYAPALILMIIGVLAVSVIAAIHGRALFVGLEALDTPRDLLPSLPMRRPLTGTTAVASPQRAARLRGPFLLLVQKEVRLYGLAFVLAAFYVTAWVALWAAGAAALLADDTFEGIAGMYALFIALLIGGISIAEERALGTADTQSLQPWPRWKQALAKLSMVGLISLLLGLAIPAGLEALLPLIESSRGVGPDLGYFRYLLPNPLNGTMATILLTALFGCYISTLSVGGVRALLAAMPLSFGLVSLHSYLFWYLDWLERTLLRRQFGPEWQKIVWKLQIADADFGMSFLYSRWMATLAFVGFAWLLLFLFLRNFRSGERGMTMARKQLPWLAVYSVLAMVLLRGGEGLLEWWLLTH
jgi:hypothetical protein